MPGPGGGGGGGFGGGSRGGGFGGGGFGGGGFGGGHHHHHHHHGHYHGGWFFGPRYYYRGGFIGGFFGALLVPVIMLLFVGMMLLSSFGSALNNVSSGGQVVYNEEIMQEYADDRYAEAFGAYENYENNLVIVFLTNEEMDGYYAIAWAGWNLQTPIYNLFGDERAEFSKMMIATINDTYYKNSLSKDLELTMDKLATRIEGMGLPDSFVDDTPYSGSMPTSRLINRSTLEMSDSLVNAALEDFTERTGIPTVIVVDEMEEAIGKTLRTNDIVLTVIFFGLIALIIFMIIKAISEKKKYGNGQNGQNGQSGNAGGYNGYKSGYDSYNNNGYGDGYRDDGRRW